VIEQGGNNFQVPLTACDEWWRGTIRLQGGSHRVNKGKVRCIFIQRERERGRVGVTVKRPETQISRHMRIVPTAGTRKVAISHSEACSAGLQYTPLPGRGRRRGRAGGLQLPRAHSGTR
jgi:hypothetical protein